MNQTPASGFLGLTSFRIPDSPFPDVGSEFLIQFLSQSRTVPTSHNSLFLPFSPSHEREKGRGGEGVIWGKSMGEGKDPCK